MTQLPKVKLYDYGLAYYPARTRLMLLEKGFDASSIVNTNILQCQNLTPEFMRKSKGTGTLPLLEIFDETGKNVVETLCDSRSISNWLDNCNQQRLGQGVCDLGKADALVTKLQEWDGNVYSAIFSDPNSKGVRDMLNSYRKAYVSARLNEFKNDQELSEAYKSKLEDMNKEPGEADGANCQNLLLSIFDEADRLLASQKYLAGEAYSEADVLLSAIIWRVRQTGRWKVEFEARPDGTKWTHVQKWFDNQVRKRNSWKGAFEMYSYQKNPLFAVLSMLPSFIWWRLTGNI